MLCIVDVDTVMNMRWISEVCRQVRVLRLPPFAGAFYLRLVGRPLDVYNYLEPLLSDFRKVTPCMPPAREGRT